MPFLDLLRRATIFPLHSFSAGVCACGNPSCTNAGKHPAIPWKGLAAGERITRDGCGHGLATGTRSGVFVVDEDVAGAWTVWLAKRGPVEPTLTVATPRPGRHYFYTLPEGCPSPNTIKELAPGLDTRGDGGFVVLAGSPHVNGGTYQVVEDRDPIPAPAALVEWLQAAHTRGASEAPDRLVGSAGAPDEATTKAIVDVLTAAWPGPGERHATQRALSGALVRGGYDPAWIVDVLTAIGGEPAKRVRTVDATVQAYEAGDPVEGWPSLANRVGQEPCDAACGALTAWARAFLGPLFDAGEALTREKKEAAVAERADPVKEHFYTYDIANRGNGDPKEKRKATPGELLWVLSTSEPWENVLRFDTHAQRIVAFKPPMFLDCSGITGVTRRDLVAIRGWFDVVCDKLVTIEDLRDTVAAVAERNKFNPLTEYLDALPAAEGDPISEAYDALTFDYEDDTHRMLWRKWLLSCMARAYSPGCKVDSAIVLQGPTSIGKSTLCKVLASEPWYRSLRWGDEARLVRATRGAWIGEFAEMQGHSKGDLDQIKAWMSESHFSHVRKYAEDSGEVPRGFTVVGTTEETEFLRDTRANRRWWVLPLKAINLAWFQENRDRLWYAVREAYRAGELWYLDTEEEREAQAEAAKAFLERDVIEASVSEYIKGKGLLDPVDVACHALTKGGQPRAKPGDLRREDRKRVIGVMRQLGCVEVRADVDGVRRRMWRAKECTVVPFRGTGT